MATRKTTTRPPAKKATKPVVKRARRPAPAPTNHPTVLGAIDVGTNAVRLELARPLPDGSLETLHEERDPVRPGEGLYKTGAIPREVANRLLSTLKRYAALCRRFGATTRAVATSAVREAKNRDEIVKRVKAECGLQLDVVSGREEARLICLGVLHGKPADEKQLLIDVGGGSTEVAFAEGEQPKHLWSVAIGAVRMTELFDSSGKVSEEKLELMRSFAREAFREALPHQVKGAPKVALGSSGSIQTVVRYASGGAGRATLAQLSRAVEKLASMPLDERRKHFDARRAEIVVGGAVVVEAVMQHLGLTAITSVDRGLRDGILVDLLRRAKPTLDDHSLEHANLALGQRFAFDEAHARQVAALALALFDQLAALHQLPAATRPLLETAAWLHDVGHAVHYAKHHRHSQYLILHSDIPGLSDRERLLASLVARFHRRSPPERTHLELETLPPAEFLAVRRLSTLLRVADALDRSHQQPVKNILATVRGNTVTVRVRVLPKRDLELELWDAERELELFGQVFGKTLEVVKA